MFRSSFNPPMDDIDAIESLTVNSAAGNITAYGGNLNKTSYYDESVTSHPVNKRLLLVTSVASDVEGCSYFAYPTSETNVRGIYAGEGAANGQQILCVDVRFKKTSAIIVQHDLFNSTFAQTMNLTIANVGDEGVFIGTCALGDNWEWHGVGSNADVIWGWAKTSNTNIQMNCSGAVTGDAIWPSQVLIPNGAF